VPRVDLWALRACLISLAMSSSDGCVLLPTLLPSGAGSVTSGIGCVSLAGVSRVGEGIGGVMWVFVKLAAGDWVGFFFWSLYA
jgi:hypothetical protein